MSEATQQKKPKKVDDDLLLLNHGTEPNWFTPGAIVQAAAQDIATREHNLRCRAERKERKEKGEPTKDINSARSYVFLAKHVRKAKTPADVIRSAIGETAKGSASLNVNTARLYRNVDALKHALVLAEQMAAPKPHTEPAEVGLPLAAA